MRGKAHNLRGHNLVAWITAFLMLVSLYAIFWYAPLEKYMLEVQKIFYIHVGAAWNAFFAFFVVFVASVLYLKTRDLKYDVLAAASAEVGLLFTTIVLLTGPIWGKHSWNTWWTWEPRLTTTLILWFIYFAYFLVRAGVAEKARRAVLSAVFGIIGFLDVPIIYISVRWWGSHPMVFGKTGGGLHPMMLHALIVSVVAFTFLYVYFCQKAMALENTRQELQEIKEKLRERI
ncbi:MAG: cytochrome c biogenesis protein [Bacillota bacterium]